MDRKFKLYFRGQSRPEIFPIGESSGQNIQSAEAQTVNSIDANYYKGIDNHAQRTLVQVGNIDTKGHNSLWGRVYDPEGIASIINSEGGGLGAKTGLYLISDSGLSRKNVEHKDIVPPRRSNTGVGSNNKIVNDKKIRRLTPTECERLQGFPDGWTEGISDTQRYKTLGNAISIPVVEEIFRRLYGIK